MGRAVLVVAGSLLIAACGADRPDLVDPGVEREVPAPDVAEADRDGPSSLRVAVDDWTGDPADAGPAALDRRVVAGLLFDGLTRFDSAGAVVPALAESWTVSDDRLTWMFNISPEAIDGSGAPVTARAAMSSLDHVAARGRDDLVAPALEPVLGWGDRMDGRAGGVAGLSAPSEDRLVIRLSHPFEPLPEVLASPAFGIVVVDEGDLRSTGAYRVDETSGELRPVDNGSALPRIVLVDAGPQEAADLLRAGEVDWAVLASDRGADLTTDVSVVPLDVSVGVAVRLDDVAARRSVASALDTVALAGAIGVDPSPPRLPAQAGGQTPDGLSIDVPAGRLERLGRAVADQLIEAGMPTEVIVSDQATFANRVLAGNVIIHPVVLAGGSWSADQLAATLVPGGENYLLPVVSGDRVSLGESLVETQDRAERQLFADLLVQTAVDEGAFVMVGQLHALVGTGPGVPALAYLPDGTLDLPSLR